MRKMVIAFAVLLAIFCGPGFAYMLLAKGDKENMDQRTVEASVTPLPTGTHTLLPTETDTPTASPTPTATLTVTSSATATLAVQVLQVTAMMPGVAFQPSQTLTPEGFQILMQPPEPTEPLPDATLLPYPYTVFDNWVSFESDHPAVRYLQGGWQPVASKQANRGQYHFTEDTNAVAHFSFEGEGVRIRYVGYTNGGVWNVVIDGTLVETIDTYAPEGLFAATRVYYTGPGSHILELQNTTNHNPASTGNMLALDAIQVYRADDLTLILNPKVPTTTPSATATPAAAHQIELIQAPPTVQPTATEPPPLVVNASLIIAYDENANNAVDLSEGVWGISVRLVEIGTNRVLAHAFTDERGFVQLQAVTTSPVAMVAPYFGQAWTLQPRTSGASETFTLLLIAGNQPGLIP